jgi:hypothetical protein
MVTHDGSADAALNAARATQVAQARRFSAARPYEEEAAKRYPYNFGGEILRAQRIAAKGRADLAQRLYRNVFDRYLTQPDLDGSIRRAGGSSIREWSPKRKEPRTVAGLLRLIAAPLHERLQDTVTEDRLFSL